MYLIFAHEVKQILGWLSLRSEHGVDGDLPQHVHGLLQLAVYRIHGGRQLLEFPFGSIVRVYHIAVDAREQLELIGDASLEEGSLGAEDDGFFVEIASLRRQVVCATHEGHGGERALGGEEMFDKHFDRNGVRIQELTVIRLAPIVLGQAMAGVVLLFMERGWIRRGRHCEDTQDAND